jgi:hypothetical protein
MIRPEVLLPAPSARPDRRAPHALPARKALPAPSVLTSLLRRGGPLTSVVAFLLTAVPELPLCCGVLEGGLA